MELLVALLTALGAVAGVVQAVVELIERSERRRRRREGGAGLGGPDAERFESPGVGGGLGTDASNVGYVTPFGAAPPLDPEVLSTSWHSCLAYLFGLVGALIFRRDPRPKVRFHAAQSLLLDVVSLGYLTVGLVAWVLYSAVRYPGPDAEIPPNDAVTWVWVLTSLTGPPVAHLVLALLALMGRHPRIPVLWKVAATISARPVSCSGSTPSDFEAVWHRVELYEGVEFRRAWGGRFVYRVRDGRVCPSRTTIDSGTGILGSGLLRRLSAIVFPKRVHDGIPREDFERAWHMMPVRGSRQLDDVTGRPYVYAILTDPRVSQTETGGRRRHAAPVELVEERPFDPSLFVGVLTAQPGCSWHGHTCARPVVAGVLVRDKGGETWHAVCDRALTALRHA
ncbi:hypothetical protein [Sphaerimonospora thailandensis]|uniref:Uncharacterized protein n=1 Tax=Sphaerimonospora thailandensis TaxID=795644 RepID=A0A8J3RBY8_9ACTN|nr:hypothetical protein [Sphaerimonospora thailandensis]GIH71805.1 hypothetical protein Mth01_40580 [Sphaerimonospora thailandensis]